MRILIIASFLLFFGTTTYAQDTKSQLDDLNNNTITENGTAQITGPVMNTMIGTMIDSMATLLDANIFALVQTFSVNPVLSSCNGPIIGNGINPVICNDNTPTITSGACGSGSNGTVVSGSTSRSGKITIGSSATTSCTISWATTLAYSPTACIFFPMNSTAAATNTTGAYDDAPTTSQIVLHGSTLASANYAYHCF